MLLVDTLHLGKVATSFLFLHMDKKKWTKIYNAHLKCDLPQTVTEGNLEVASLDFVHNFWLRITSNDC